MSMSMEDIFIKRMWVWVLNDLGFLSLSVFRLWAARGGANWVRLDIRVKLDGESPVMVQVLLSVCQVLVCRDDVSIKLWSEVVIDILGWVVPLSLGSLGSEFKPVRFHALGEFERSVVINDISVNTEVWHCIVDLVTKWLLLVLVLSATGRRADWIGLRLFLGLDLEVVIWVQFPLAMNTLLRMQVTKRVNNIWVNWLVNIVFNWIFWFILLPLPPMTKLLLGKVKTLEVLVDQVISSEVWHWIVDLVAKTLGLVLVLSATS